jgi:hypothetical protein
MLFFLQIKSFLQGTGKSREGKAETGKGAGKIPGEGSKVRDTSRVWKDKCNIFGYNTDLKREYHEIIVSIHLHGILVHSSPNEMLYKALVGDCS